MYVFLRTNPDRFKKLERLGIMVATIAHDVGKFMRKIGTEPLNISATRPPRFQQRFYEIR